MVKILLIDDDAQLGAPLAAYLRRFDFELDCALTPSAGLALLHRGHYEAARFARKATSRSSCSPRAAT